MTEVALNREDGMKTNTSPTGRTFHIHPKNNTSLYCIQATDKQVVPKELEGMFTDPKNAQFAIETFLRKAWDINDEAVMRSKRKATAAKREELEKAS